MEPKVIAIDFDGTVVKHRYPEIGEDIGALPVLEALQNNKHKFILYTMRDATGSRNLLKEATEWFSKRGINLIGVNTNPWQSTWTSSPKVNADLYIDDHALGIPLKRDSPSDRPYVDWTKCAALLYKRGLLTESQILLINNNSNLK